LPPATPPPTITIGRVLIWSGMESILPWGTLSCGQRGD
jgi:hypothetical protein